MIKCIKVFNYRGIKDIELTNLGKVNVICGKNSSGKSSILEALSNENHYSVGVIITDIVAKDLINLFTSEVKKRSIPDPDYVLEWYSKFIDAYKSNKEIWYNNELRTIENEFRIAQDNDSYLKNYDSRTYNYGLAIDKILSEEHKRYKPILIPPKRSIKSSNTINLNEELTANGDGVLNRIFYLKNQDTNSNEHKLYNYIYNSFNNITTYNFNIIPDKSNSLKLMFRIANQWLEAEHCGLGLRDVLVILTLILATDYNFYLIEEPENHIHADFQKRLLNFINNIENKQFILSTHSNVFLDPDNVNNILYCWFDDKVNISDKTSLSKISNSLGYSVNDSITSDAIILVEGPSDILIIQKILNWIKASNEYNIKFWPLGGDIMAALDLSIFCDRKNVFALIDSDPGSKSERVAFMRNCRYNKIKCHKLDRYSIENYFSIQAIKETFPNQIPSSIDALLPNVSVDTQIGFKEKDKSIKRKILQIVEKMSLHDFENTDLLKYLYEIKSIPDREKQLAASS